MRNLKTILIVVIFLAIGIGFLFLPIREWFLQLEGQVRSLGIAGPVLVAFAYSLMTVLLIPGSALTIGAGTLFGLKLGVLVVIFGGKHWCLLFVFTGSHVSPRKGSTLGQIKS